MHLDAMTPEQVAAELDLVEAGHRAHRGAGLDLDLTRGKPSRAQLELAAGLDGVLGGDYRLADGSDARGYGGLDGIPEARALGAQWLGVPPGEVLAGGNSSLELMALFVLQAHRCGLDGPGSAWAAGGGPVRFVCPVPGYDRHFAICADLGIEMVTVPMTPAGPDMDAVERRVREDPAVRGLWCVPKHSNPTGATCDAETVERVAALGRAAHPTFRVLWDNAYGVHDLGPEPVALAPVREACERHGTADSVVQFASTSKVTFAGAGVSFFAGSPRNLDALRARLRVMTIGPDKVNQLRHVRFLRDLDGVRGHMRGHAAVLGPKFECVEAALEGALQGRGMGEWTRPAGGYFVSFDAPPGHAREIVALAAEAGVRLTPAGAAFPHGEDPRDANIRLAPSFPPLEEVERAMAVFVNCVRLACLRRRAANR